MALVDTTLQTALLTIFNAMKTMTSGGDLYMAQNMASAIKTYILTATVSTTDVGTVTTTSSYAGIGTGAPGCFVIDNNSLASSLYDVFTDENTTDDDIADGIADSIDAVCSDENIISTTTIGTLTPPSGPPVTGYTGTGKGTFTGSKSIIANKLKGSSGTFAQMKNMESGGDALFAADLAKAIGDYLRGGTVNVKLDSPITGSGSGGVS